MYITKIVADISMRKLEMGIVWEEIVTGVSCSCGSCLGGSFPGGSYLVGICPGGSYLGGSCPVGVLWVTVVRVGVVRVGVIQVVVVRLGVYICIYYQIYIYYLSGSSPSQVCSGGICVNFRKLSQHTKSTIERICKQLLSSISLTMACFKIRSTHP